MGRWEVGQERVFNMAKRVAGRTNSHRLGDFGAFRTAAPHSCIFRIQDLHIRPEQHNLYRKGQENLAHVLAGCSVLAQSKYLERHNTAFKVLFFDMCRALNLVETVPLWFSKTEPKPMYKAFSDVPIYVDHTFVSANRVDARFVNLVTNQVILVKKPRRQKVLTTALWTCKTLSRIYYHPAEWDHRRARGVGLKMLKCRWGRSSV